MVFLKMFIIYLLVTDVMLCLICFCFQSSICMSDWVHLKLFFYYCF